MQRQVLSLGLVAMLVVLAGCGATPFRASEQFELDVPWAGFERVAVRTTNGRVTLRSGDRENIRVAGEKQAGGRTLGEARSNVEQLTVVARPDESDATTLVVRLDVPEHLRDKAPGASFDICVPEACAADIATGNGRVHVSGMKGSALLRTSNGRIVIQHLDGSVDATTSNGHILAESVGGDCRLSTSNGGVEVRDASGSLWVTTSNGSILAHATPPPEGEVVLQTSNGSIRADLPANLRGELSLITSNGRVYTDLDQVTLTSPRWSKRSMEAEINGGGAGKVVAHTSNGSITLNCR